MAWTNLMIQTSADSAEKITDYLIELGAISASIQDKNLNQNNEEIIFGEPHDGPQQYWKENTISALFEENIEVDVQELDINQSIHLTEIKLPKGVEFLTSADKDHDSAIVKCYQPVEEVIETEAPEAIAEPEDATASKGDAATEDAADDTKES